MSTVVREDVKDHKGVFASVHDKVFIVVFFRGFGAEYAFSYFFNFLDICHSPWSPQSTHETDFNGE